MFPEFGDICITPWTTIKFMCLGSDKLINNSDNPTIVLHNEEHCVDIRVLLQDVTIIENGKDFNKTTSIPLR